MGLNVVGIQGKQYACFSVYVITDVKWNMSVEDPDDLDCEETSQ